MLPRHGSRLPRVRRAIVTFAPPPMRDLDARGASVAFRLPLSRRHGTRRPAAAGWSRIHSRLGVVSGNRRTARTLRSAAGQHAGVHVLLRYGLSAMARLARSKMLGEYDNTGEATSSD